MNKKLFIIPLIAMTMLAIASCKGNKASNGNEAAAPDTTITDEHWGAQLNGTIGSANDCDLYFFDGAGDFSYTFRENVTARRIVKLDSYDPVTGRLVLRCNDVNGGQYTGSYNGILHKSGTNLTYKGTYTNYKGVVIGFALTGQYLTQPTKKEEAVKVIEWDKVTCQVTGPVKKIVEESGKVIKFNEQGKITSWIACGEETMKQRKHGRIEYIGGIDFGENYSYDVNNGRLSKTESGGEGGYNCTETYTYDAEGNVTSIKVKEEEMDDYNNFITTTNKTFTVKDVKDSHGNWVARTYNGYTRKRTITYYE